jgi:hypothetical protein
MASAGGGKSFPKPSCSSCGKPKAATPCCGSTVTVFGGLGGSMNNGIGNGGNSGGGGSAFGGSFNKGGNIIANGEHSVTTGDQSIGDNSKITTIGVGSTAIGNSAGAFTIYGPGVAEGGSSGNGGDVVYTALQSEK